MKNKTILFTTLVALSMMMSASHAMLASSTHECQGNSCNNSFNDNSQYDSNNNNSVNNSNNTDSHDIYNQQKIDNRVTNNNQSYDNRVDDSNHATGGSVSDVGNNDIDIRNTNRATGGAGGDANSTAYGGTQGQMQGQGQSATTGNQSSNNSTTVNTGSTEVANKTITYKKAGYDLPPAAPAISPTVIGQMGTTGVSGAVSTPFGGISGGFSKTNKEGKDLMKAQAEALRVQSDTLEAMTESNVMASDIQNLKDAEMLPEADRAIIKEFILNKYRRGNK